MLPGWWYYQMYPASCRCKNHLKFFLCVFGESTQRGDTIWKWLFEDHTAIIYRTTTVSAAELSCSHWKFRLGWWRHQLHLQYSEAWRLFSKNKLQRMKDVIKYNVWELFLFCLVCWIGNICSELPIRFNIFTNWPRTSSLTDHELHKLTTVCNNRGISRFRAMSTNTAINDRSTNLTTLGRFSQSKKISNDQELIQSDPTSCPINQKGNN